MKKIAFVMILLASSLFGRSQQLISGKGVKFTLPNEAIRLNPSPASKMTVYKIGEILLNFYDSSKKLLPNSLERYKGNWDVFYTKGESPLSPEDYTSYIKAYSHCQVAVYRIGTKESEGTYFFYAVNKTETCFFVGNFNYNKGALAKADAFLTDLLNSLEFTK